MKIILLKDVNGVGKRHDIKTVADGYALNNLIPRGLAEVATKTALVRIETIKKQEQSEKKIQEDLLSKNLKSIHDACVEVSLPVNEKGHLFAGIHATEIAPLLSIQTKINVSPEFIKLEKPIKEVGEHKIDISVHGKQATFILKVKAK